jgi:hypothetical protein
MLIDHHRTRTGTRLLCLLALAAVAALVAGCGGASGGGAAAKGGAPGSPSNPLVGKLTEDNDATRNNEVGNGKSGGTQMDYQKLLERQTSKPHSQFTPCNLVSPARARAILGGPIQAPIEAPQGPTCIYRTKTNSRFVTVAVQPLSLATVKRQLKGREAVALPGRTAYCGVYGQAMLYAGLSGGRVLAIGGRCSLAREFAASAVKRLG